MRNSSVSGVSSYQTLASVAGAPQSGGFMPASSASVVASVVSSTSENGRSAITVLPA
jgi:hypothetical protein